MTISDYLSEILHDSIKAVAEKQMTISIKITPEHESIRIEPSTDVVERKKGEWIDSKCSECGGLIPITKVMLRGEVMWETDYSMSRFCPNCGADMREEKMTNKAWMATLTAEQFYNKMMNLIYNYGFKFDNTRLAIINWLDEPHESEVKDEHIN